MQHLVVDSLHKVYAGAQGGVHALRGVSFSLPAGAFVALCGPSGCGKSTLLHIVGGMDRPTSGQVLLAGRALEKLSRSELAQLRRREVGFVFQAFHLLPTLTVTENVALPLTLDGQSQAAAHARAAELLDYVGLPERARAFPSQLSGGEMQRVAVARAVIAQPRLIVADEPTGSLDSENGRLVMEQLRKLNQQLGITVLLATHSPEAARYAQRIMRLKDGRIESIDENVGLSTTV
jgi:putative ABC transport system ATP-binding protein